MTELPSPIATPRAPAIDVLRIDSIRLQQQIRFILEIDSLKDVMRRSRLLSDDRFENSAEHSWHLAMLALILAEYANAPIDQARVIKMVLVHDIVELDAGDTYCYDEVGAQDKEEREQRAAERIFGLLPSDQRDELRALWDEFEAGVTPDARFANTLDRVMPIMHNLFTGGGSWIENGITRSQVLQRNGPVKDGSDTLWQIVETIIEVGVARNLLQDS